MTNSEKKRFGDTEEDTLRQTKTQTGTDINRKKKDDADASKGRPTESGISRDGALLYNPLLLMPFIAEIDTDIDMFFLEFNHGSNGTDRNEPCPDLPPVSLSLPGVMLNRPGEYLVFLESRRHSLQHSP
ncbi:hypothetical protein ElyMa_007000100 [Elysia marginata]|uniref:Uncharacterized protein n=1 Tax=Elysia marginata TaxID=1093978 RepID=A0AAV4JPR1_9GAST|nr:hypothetical protein ElyMa_007000100 [Elysia marginata]